MTWSLKSEAIGMAMAAILPPSFWFPAKTLSAVPWPAGFLVLPAFRFDRRPHKNPQLRQVSKVGYQIPMFISKIKNVWYSDDMMVIE